MSSVSSIIFYICILVGHFILLHFSNKRYFILFVRQLWHYCPINLVTLVVMKKIMTPVNLHPKHNPNSQHNLYIDTNVNYLVSKNIIGFLYCKFVVTPCVYIPREGSALELAYKLAYAKSRVVYTSWIFTDLYNVTCH